MEDKYEEAKIQGAKEPEPLDSSEHKEKGCCICKISGKEGKIGTGFFCKIRYENELVPVLITNYHVIDDNYIGLSKRLKVYINEKSKFINLSKNKIIYSSSDNKYDIIIIRLLDNEIKHYLKIDENIFENSEKEYKDEPIYILYYPGKDEKAKVSYSEKGIEKINEYDIKHYCNTEEGSSGSPILSSMTNKIIGIHKAANRKRGYNFGSFLKYPLSELKGNKIEIYKVIDLYKSASKNKQYNIGGFLNYPIEDFLNKYNEKKNYNNYENKYSQKNFKKNFYGIESDIIDYENKNENKYQTTKMHSEIYFENKYITTKSKNNNFSKKYENNYNDIKKQENKIYKNNFVNQFEYEYDYFKIQIEKKFEEIFHNQTLKTEEIKLVKQLFYKLYNEGLVSDVKKISTLNYGKFDIKAIKFVCTKKNIIKNWEEISKTWIPAYHGTKFDYLESILKYGLKLPQTKLKNGTLTPKPIDIPLTYKVSGIENWENAIFASPNLFYALDKRYSGTILENSFIDYNAKLREMYYSPGSNNAKVVLLVKIKPNSFTKHKSKVIAKFHVSHSYFVNNDFDINDIYRISSENDIAVTSVIFMNYFIWELSDSEKMELSDYVLSLIKD